MSNKTRYYKISSKGVSYSFATPEELDGFIKQQNIKAAQFSITDVENLSNSCVKETEIITMQSTF